VLGMRVANPLQVSNLPHIILIAAEEGLFQGPPLG
jgi:hypothetical protein